MVRKGELDPEAPRYDADAQRTGLAELDLAPLASLALPQTACITHKIIR